MKIKNGIKIKDVPLVSTDEKKSKLKDLIEQWEKLLETIEKNT